jgi:hypothetical protein
MHLREDFVYSQMDHHFSIPVTYKGAEMQFEARFQTWAYGRRFYVFIEGVEVLFEQDEEGSIRAIMPAEEKGKIPAKELLQDIAAVIQQL